MGYFNNKKNVEKYIKITEGYDGSKLINTNRQSNGNSLNKLNIKELNTI